MPPCVFFCFGGSDKDICAIFRLFILAKARLARTSLRYTNL